MERAFWAVAMLAALSLAASAQSGQCRGCAAGAAPVQATVAQPAPAGAIESLIPLAVVIVGGCEACAEKMVTRALGQGSSPQEIERTLRVIAVMQKLDCFAKTVGPETLARMEKPLAAGRRALQQATAQPPR